MQTSNTVTPVLNNRESLIQCQIPETSRDGVRQQPRLLSLMPGMNFPDTDLLEEAKKNPVFQSHFKTKIAPSRAPEQNPERVGQMTLVEGAPVDKDNPLYAMDVETAVATCEELFDVAQLKRFLDSEEREQVRSALKAQINKISKRAGDGPASK